MLLDKCPHCDATHVQAGQVFEQHFNQSRPGRTWRLVRCQNPDCQRLVLVTNDPDEGLSIHPPASYELDPDLQIGNEIREDFKEAGLCLSAACYKASMVMSRRVLQRALKEQGITKHRLVDAIDEAIEKDVLRTSFHAVATEIREYGNLGAHPDDDQLQNATKEKAQLILDFYEVPAAAGKLREDRERAEDI